MIKDELFLDAFLDELEKVAYYAPAGQAPAPVVVQQQQPKRHTLRNAVLGGAALAGGAAYLKNTSRKAGGDPEKGGKSGVFHGLGVLGGKIRNGFGKAKDTAESAAKPAVDAVKSGMKAGNPAETPPTQPEAPKPGTGPTPVTGPAREVLKRNKAKTETVKQGLQDAKDKNVREALGRSAKRWERSANRKESRDDFKRIKIKAKTLGVRAKGQIAKVTDSAPGNAVKWMGRGIGKGVGAIGKSVGGSAKEVGGNAVESAKNYAGAAGDAARWAGSTVKKSVRGIANRLFKNRGTRSSTQAGNSAAGGLRSETPGKHATNVFTDRTVPTHWPPRR